MHDKEQQKHNDEEVKLAPRCHCAHCGLTNGGLELLGRAPKARRRNRATHAALDRLSKLVELVRAHALRHGGKPTATAASHALRGGGEPAAAPA